MKEERQGNQRAGFLLKETLETWGKGHLEITSVWVVFLPSFSQTCYIRRYVSTDPISHPYEFSSFVEYSKTDMSIKKETRWSVLHSTNMQHTCTVPLNCSRHFEYVG